jgi:hypothetical protein
MDETLTLIQNLSNERQLLYRLAAKQHLNTAQQTRLGEINFHLPNLWDRYRRELVAARQWSRKQSIPFVPQRKAA